MQKKVAMLGAMSAVAASQLTASGVNAGDSAHLSGYRAPAFKLPSTRVRYGGTSTKQRYKASKGVARRTKKSRRKYY